jgi:uncharacterized protein (DUF1501 family)
MDRRKFIKNSALASSVFFVPSFVSAFENDFANSFGFKRLVIVQLSGGNDGLNTIIPYRNDIYYKKRPTIAISKNEILKIDDELGFHESLEPLKRLYDDGYLCVLNNVGYPNPNRSHFRSLDIWQSASDSNQYLQNGWIGRYLDHYGKQAYNAIQIDESLSLAMKGKKLNAIATKNPATLFKTANDPFFNNVLKHYDDTHLSEHNLGYLYKTMISAKSSAKYIHEKNKIGKSNQDYPKHKFANQLRTTARFINSRLDTKVFYTSLGGFDTHANQQNKQKRLLQIYAESIEAFVEDLKDNNTFEDTLILTFSEFGRRVTQNAGNGTDHGTANNVFIIGKNLKTQGIYNNLVSLNDLDANGDLKFEIDFRSIYATILNKWLEVDDTKILNKEFEKLEFL